MRALSLPKSNPIRALDQIANAKDDPHKGEITAMRATLTSAIGTYAPAQFRRIAPVSLTKEQRTALLHCYDSETAVLGGYRKNLLEAAGSLCPYCGLNWPATLDHWLPKQVFPEFAVFLYNLIPCCDPCNRRKGKRWRTTAGDLLFLHAYYDRVPAGTKCLHATVRWGRKKAPVFSFELRPDPGVPSPLYDTLVEHVDKLKLLTLYRKAAPEVYSEAIDVMHPAPSLKRLRHRVRETAEKKRGREGALSWRAAVWDAVADSDDALKRLWGSLGGASAWEAEIDGV